MALPLSADPAGLELTKNPTLSAFVGGEGGSDTCVMSPPALLSGGGMGDQSPVPVVPPDGGEWALLDVAGSGPVTFHSCCKFNSRVFRG
jgi:hypothetical protein